MNRRICYVSGTRADFGLMVRALKMVRDTRKANVFICVTGMHLLPQYGSTVVEIENSGLEIISRIPTPLEGRSGAEMARALGTALIGMSDAFERFAPDLIVVLGDRGEMLAGAVAAVHQNIPVAHLHGGERSGTIDESFRHSISKLAHYHFVSTSLSRDRLIRMGENPDCIFVTGAPSLDDLVSLKRLTRNELCKSVGFAPDKRIALVLYHPVVQEQEQMGQQTSQLMQAVFDHGFQVICLLPNSDAGGASMRSVLERGGRNNQTLRTFAHLPRQLFVSWMAEADVLIGNSSCGIIEAASLNLPVVNVGSRQRERERSGNVVDAEATYDSIYNAIDQALAMEGPWTNVYGSGGASTKIAELLIDLPLGRSLLSKSNAY